jgi:orotidine-5'-phosphate decarboxylase
MARNFMELLKAKWNERKFVCIGLDTDLGKLPIAHLGLHRPRKEELLEAQGAYREAQKTGKPLAPWHVDLLVDAMMTFNERIIKATRSMPCAYKLNSAFYEALGGAGISVLHSTMAYARGEASDVPLILDYKRGDIGNTNLGYVQAAAMADAVTVHPYLGWEANLPFLEMEDKGVFVLCRTSNPGAGEFQDPTVMVEPAMLVESLPPLPEWLENLQPQISMPAYKYVAHRVKYFWNRTGNCCVVAGATYPQELAEIRKIVGDIPILIPGIGSQGGNLEATVKAGVNSNGQGMVINNSRAILFASSGPDFAEAARAAAEKMHEDINAVLAAA